MLRYGSILVVVLALLFATHVAAGSPWVQEQHEGFFQVSAYRIDAYERLFRSSGPDFILNREITDTTVEAYVEYGLTDQWTLIGVAPFKLLESGKQAQNPTSAPTLIERGTESMFGNLEVGFRRRIKHAAYALSAQVDLELPTGGLDRATGLSSGYDAVTVTPTMSLGKGFSRAYVQGCVGLGLRTDDFSNDWRVGVEVGGKFFGRLWLVGLADLVQSFEDGDVAIDPANLQTGLYLNDQEYVAYALKILVDITPRIGVQASSYSATGGNNVARRELNGLGLYFKW